ncbi:MAG: aminotransferase class V-fold PLP-dependent enzyme [Candidatus Latescibacter sp.]|nr:aminotransferase class V-fold PLP-dependent enzyme [Candidatus Latescibacter sp.]
MTGFSTKAIHGIRLTGDSSRKDVHGSLRMPVYDSAAFEYESSKELQLAFEGKLNTHSYSRISNPTVEDFEQRVRLLSDALGVIAVSSGMAAIANVLITLAEAGSNIVTTRFLFGNTLSLLGKTLKDWGLETRFVDMSEPESIERIIDDGTRAVFLEVITNPQLEVADVKKITEIAHSRRIPVIVDGTLTTPYIFKSKDFGVDIEIISSTKYMSGGATSVGGVIIDNGLFDWSRCGKLKEDSQKYGNFTLLAKLKREVFRNLGSCLSPHNAYLQTLGLETMSLRIDKSCANALEMARFLERHPVAKSVRYPGLESSRFHEIAVAQFGNKFGGLLTFELGNRDDCYRFMDNLRIIRRATNLNDNKTLVLHPASTIFCEFSVEQKKEMGVSDSMVRLAAGIEDSEDILEDIEQALEVI